MEIEGTGEEGAHGSTDDAAANEEGAGADETAGEEAAKAAAAEVGEGLGDRTDDPEAVGAPGAAQTANPSAASVEPSSEEPQPGAYLKGAGRGGNF